MDQPAGRALAAAVAAALLCGAAAPSRLKPLPHRAPTLIAPPSLRVHVRAHEDLEPDDLRAFARPNVTLWLTTRSNALRASTLEHLQRFDASFVRLTAPLSDAQLHAFASAPRAGVWLDASQLGGRGLVKALGPRALAVQLNGALDEAAFERLVRARPAFVEWLPKGEVDVLAFSLLRQLPGRKVVTLEASGLPPRACPSAQGGPSARLHLASLLALGASPFPCGKAPIVVVAADTDRWLLQSAVVSDPTLELELDVGDDGASAKKAAALLDELGLGPHR